MSASQDSSHSCQILGPHSLPTFVEVRVSKILKQTEPCTIVHTEIRRRASDGIGSCYSQSWAQGLTFGWSKQHLNNTKVWCLNSWISSRKDMPADISKSFYFCGRRFYPSTDHLLYVAGSLTDSLGIAGHASALARSRLAVPLTDLQNINIRKVPVAVESATSPLPTITLLRTFVQTTHP